MFPKLPIFNRQTICEPRSCGCIWWEIHAALLQQLRAMVKTLPSVLNCDNQPATLRAMQSPWERRSVGRAITSTRPREGSL